MASDAPTFTIEETTGPRRTITLVGRALPYRPLKLDGEQRVEVEYPSGSPEGVAQVFGPTEGDCTVAGFWKDKYLGSPGTAFKLDGAPVTACVAAIEAMDSFRVQGQRVRVAWGPIVRFGHVKKFEQTWHNTHDVEWSVTFVWTSKSDYVQQSSLPIGDGLGSSASAFRRLVDGARRALQTPLALAAEYSDLVNSNLDRIGAFANELDDLSNAYARAAASPLQSLNRAESALLSIANIGGTVSDRMASSMPNTLVAGLTRRFSGGSGEAALEGEARERAAMVFADELEAAAFVDTFNRLVRAQTIQQEELRQMRKLRNEAVMRARMQTARPGDIQAQHIAREGEDLRDVSSIYYGTPGRWQALMLYNGLESSDLVPGQGVLIPRQTSEEGAEG